MRDAIAGMLTMSRMGDGRGGGPDSGNPVAGIFSSSDSEERGGGSQSDRQTSAAEEEEELMEGCYRDDDFGECLQTWLPEDRGVFLALSSFIGYFANFFSDHFSFFSFFEYR